MSSNPFDAAFKKNPFDAVFALRPPKSAPAATTAPVPAAGGDPLVGYLQKAGFQGEALKTAWAIAKRESGGRPEAYNPDAGTGDLSYGLFQINMLGNLGPDRRKRYGLKKNEDLYDPETNARVAYAMSKGGTDFGAWGVGPNAYRKTAPLNFAGFPGASTLPYRPSGKLPVSEIPLAQGRATQFTAMGDDDPFAALFQNRPAPAGRQQPAQTVPLDLPKGVINTSTWRPKGTHITSGLDLNKGSPSAVDIMAKPGTAVAAPASGTVLRLGSAQGGQSMYFKDDNGYVWWLGHIDGRYSLPAGTRVRAGQTLSRISADHAAPHLHLDRTYSPSNQFG